MDTARAEKLEALEAARDYSERLKRGMQTVAEAFRSNNRDADIETLLKQCIDGLNWVIEIYNRTSDVLNEKEVLIQKEQVNESIQALSVALQADDGTKIADSFEDGVIQFLEEFCRAVVKVQGNVSEA